MKSITVLVCALAMPLYAGPSGKEVVTVPEPSVSSWFAGASAGYLLDFDEPMYHLHLGQDTDYQLGGWDFAWFLEIGYTEKSDSYTGLFSGSPTPITQNFDLDDLENYLAATAGATGNSYDLDVMPITINAKLERDLNDKWSAYIGAGIGMSQIDLDVTTASPATSISGDDWVLTAQIFTGLIYNINEKWEVYGGARYIHFDEADIGAYTFDMEDDVLLELGARYNF